MTKKKSKKLTLAVPCVAADKDDRGFLTWQDRFGCLWYLAMMIMAMITIKMVVLPGNDDRDQDACGDGGFVDCDDG